jgi:predicted  nucleic acid-binding Zn-ribbon protein
VHPDIAALVSLQQEDLAIASLEARLANLEPRLRELDRSRATAEAQHAETHQAVETEERRAREVRERLAEHRQLQEHHEAALRQVTTAREATAATLQLEQARRMMATDGRELDTISGRVQELRATLARHAEAVSEVERTQVAAREAIARERQETEAELAAVRKRRGDVAAQVSRSLLGRYERIRARKGVPVLFPLRAGACSHCDTSVPLQRRNAMATGSTVDVCEVCGVLLHAGE